MKPLTITRHIGAPAPRVFEAWCNPAVMKRWFAPGDLQVAEVTAEARHGGRYRIVMQAPDGKQNVVEGEYLDLQPDQVLEFTWRWAGTGGAVTIVRIDLQSDAAGTELTLTHTGFSTEDSRNSHEQGWTGCLLKLVALAA